MIAAEPQGDAESHPFQESHEPRADDKTATQTPALEEKATPLGAAGSVLLGQEMSSDDPPKRKRLGWGQGLARLQSRDVKPLGAP